MGIGESKRLRKSGGVGVKMQCKRIPRCYCKSQFAVAFGLGLVIACFCPTRLTLFFAGLIIAALGVVVAKQ